MVLVEQIKTSSEFGLWVRNFFGDPDVRCLSSRIERKNMLLILKYNIMKCFFPASKREKKLNLLPKGSEREKT